MITHRPRPGLIGGLALTLAVTGLTALATGNAANAAPHYESAEPVQVGWTDSATPEQSYDSEGRNLPLGTSVDESGQSHTSRVYATFDLAPFKGDKIYGGTVYIQETGVADCSKRAIEIWRTKAISKTPTWNRSPKPLAKVDEILTAGVCPNATITFDVGSAVRDAVQGKEKSITFEIRVPAQYEADPTYARQIYWFRHVQLTVQHNSVPKIDSSAMFNSGFACDRQEPYRHLGRFAPLLQAVGTDADQFDQNNLRTEFGIWPTNDESARTLLSAEHGRSGRANGVTIPEGTLVDGQTYAWQARVGDGTDVSKWSKTCFFTYDGSAPPEPTVTSANYPPEGGRAPLGELGVFTFSGNGNPDIAGFQYAWSSLPANGCEYSGTVGELVCTDPFEWPNAVRADAPGGSATVTLNPPGSAWRQLYVRALDAAGNVSRTVTYETFIPSSSPEIRLESGTPRWGQEVQLKLTPANGLTDVREYQITVDRETVTWPAEADGTATFTFTADNIHGPTVTVRSVSGNGFVSEATGWSVFFYQWPTIESDLYHSPPDAGPVGGVGVEASFTFSPPPGGTDIVAYEYFFYYQDADQVQGPTQVSAGADGTATITWAPEHSGWVDLFVHAIRADGSTSDANSNYYFEVA